MGVFTRIGASAYARVLTGLIAVVIAIGTHALPTPVAAQAPDCASGGEITITRNYPRGLPTPGTFTYEVRGPGNDNTVVDTVTFTFHDGHSGVQSDVAHTPPGVTGSFRVVETQTPPSIAPSPDVTVTIDPNTDPPCADGVAYEIAIDPNATVRVVKTETVGRRFRDEAIGKWTFKLTGEGGFSATKRTNTNGSRHVVKFRSVPPGGYTLCEQFSGWRSNLGNGSGYITPNGDRCVDFQVRFDEVRTFRVNNRCPLS